MIVLFAVIVCAILFSSVRNAILATDGINKKSYLYLAVFVFLLYAASAISIYYFS